MFTPNEYGLFSMPTLETPRLILRRMTMKDAKDIFEYSRDEEVACHVLWSAQRDIGEAKDYCRYMLRRYRADEPSSWGIIDRQTRHLVGTIGYMDYSMDNASVEIGYSLARWLWNDGYMTEALRAMVQNARVLVMDEPTANLDCGNSALVMERVSALAGEGFTVIFSTHDPNQAFRYATQVLALQGGGVLAAGRPEEALTSESLTKLYGVGMAVCPVTAAGKSFSVAVVTGGKTQ